MPNTQGHTHKAFWFITISIFVIAFGLMIVPTMITLNSMRPQLEAAILAQTGVVLKINGDVNFSILGGTNIIAHDVITPHGRTKKLSVKIPFSGLFDRQNLELDNVIRAYGADIYLTTLATLQLKYNLTADNSVLHFMGKDYHIIHGEFINGTFNGLVRTGQHKYDIKFIGNQFFVKNKNLNLEINGEFFSAGGAAGTLEINTDKINSWFEFDDPPLTRRIKLGTNFVWDGGSGFKFFDLVANNVRGNIDIEPTGWRNITLVSDDTVFDFSFLAHPTKILYNTKLDIDFYGDLTFNNQHFKHVIIDVVSTEEYIQIAKVIADGLVINGGTIDVNGAHDVMISTNFNNEPLECLFSGTATKWQCSTFKYGDISGKIELNGKHIDATIATNRNMTLDELQGYLAHFDAETATVKFKFANMGGVYRMTKRGASIEYNYIYGKTLRWINPHMKLLPKFMLDAPGNMVWTNDVMNFIPNTNDWYLTLHNNFFSIGGKSIQKWFPKTDLQSLNDLEYSATGFYNKHGDISDLTLKIGGHVFTGSVDSNGVSLHTNELVLDVFLNQDFFDRYEETEFLVNSPIMIPFDFNKNIYLSADSLTYGQNTYKNFVYALKSGTQTFSITDADRGNILGTIIKEHANYDIFIQLNKFAINGKLLSNAYPLNILNTSITAELNLKTSGHIAHDIWYNMAGDIDVTFDGGYLSGIGLDGFYADAENITRLNVESRLMAALERGMTKIKTMRVIGEYKNGNFTTTKPIELSVRHADIVGNLNINGDAMTGKFDISLRAAAPDPVKVSFSIAPNGKRGYSMSDILRYFDPAFMRSFIKTHNKF